MVQRVMSVDSASVFLLKSNPPYVGVTAHGKVPTTGWTRPDLGAWVYVMPPSDGIQDFDFYADPPTGITLPVVSPIAAHAVITRDPNDYWGKGQPLVGVRIHARENSLVAKLDKKNSAGGGYPAWTDAAICPLSLALAVVDQLYRSRRPAAPMAIPLVHRSPRWS